MCLLINVLKKHLLTVFVLVLLTHVNILKGSPTLPSKVGPYIPVGIYLGNIEEGARIITFVRLFPLGHPLADGHEFPTANVLHIGEVEIFLEMGKTLGWNLYATLHRFPDPPRRDWFYSDFEPPPNIKSEGFIINKRQTVPLPGLRSITCHQKQPLAYIFDTRSLTLEERSMERPTSSGVEISRNRLDERLKFECERTDSRQLSIIKFE